MKYLVMLLLVSCVSTVQQDLDPKIYWKHDMCFKLKKDNESSKFRKFFDRFKTRKYRKESLKEGEVVYCGVGVLPDLEKYHIEIIAENKLDRLEMTSCHEDHVVDKVDKTGSRGIATITYIPTIEKGEACPLEFGGFSKRNKNASGSLFFQHNSLQLEATLYCNGYVSNEVGVSVCQSKEGLRQKIEFKEQVYVTKPVNGKAPRNTDCPQLFEDGITEKFFLLPNRDCVYTFIGKDSKKIMRLTTIGYEGTILR